MIETLKFDGMPKVKISKPDNFVWAIFKHKKCGAVKKSKVDLIGINYKIDSAIPVSIFNKSHTSAWPLIVCKCGGQVYGKPIKGTYNQSVKCDGRCLNATGPNCDCSCGGSCHGDSNR